MSEKGCLIILKCPKSIPVHGHNGWRNVWYPRNHEASRFHYQIGITQSKTNAKVQHMIKKNNNDASFWKLQLFKWWWSKFIIVPLHSSVYSLVENCLQHCINYAYLSTSFVPLYLPELTPGMHTIMCRSASLFSFSIWSDVLPTR